MRMLEIYSIRRKIRKMNLEMMSTPCMLLSFFSVLQGAPLLVITLY
jgi:hypothetical protein